MFKFNTKKDETDIKKIEFRDLKSMILCKK